MKRCALLLVLIACGHSPADPGGAGGSGGSGGSSGGSGGSSGPCAVVKVGADGHTFTPLHDGDTVSWQRGSQAGGCCHIWTAMQAIGFKDDEHVLYQFHVIGADGTDEMADSGYCARFGALDSAAGWRVDTCERSRIDGLTRGTPTEGPVKLRVTIRDGIAFDSTQPNPCTILDVPHCEASAEVTVNALAPPPVDSAPAPCAP